MKKHMAVGALVAIAILFAIINVVWFVRCKVIYDGYADGFTVDEEVGICYMVDEDGYIYDVKKPSYLKYTGSLSVTKDLESSLIIWPGLNEETSYGMLVNYDDSMYQLYVTAQGELVDDEYTKDEIEAYENNKEQILIYIEKAHNTWEID